MMQSCPSGRVSRTPASYIKYYRAFPAWYANRSIVSVHRFVSPRVLAREHGVFSALSEDDLLVLIPARC